MTFSLKDIFDQIYKEVSGFEAYNFVKMISSFHRIQISDGLWNVSKAIAEEIEKRSDGIPDVEVKSIPVSEAPEWLPTPPGWNINEGWVEVENERLTLREHPTLAVAHSPSTEGILEAEAVIINKWWEPQEYEKTKGKVVVTDGDRTIVYKFASEAGAVAVAFYRKGTPETAVPYIGLFLSYKDLSKSRLPAISLPYRIVKEIKGKKIKIYIDSELKPNPEIPIVCARFGERRNLGPLISSHICHPAPGANDNASGSAANLECALSLSRIIRKNLLKIPEKTIRFLWIPEYTGTIVAIEKFLKGKVSQVINLDMVGVEPGGNEGPLHLYLSSLSAPGDVEKISFLTLLRITELSNLSGYTVEPYSGGSDHDIFIAYGSPGVTLIQWPDTRYHTDEDDVNRISKRMLKATASTALSTAYILASEIEIPLALNDFREWFLKKIYIKRLSEDDNIGAKLVGSFIAKHYGLKTFSDEPKLSELPEDIRPKRKVPVIFGSRQVAQRSFEKALKLSKTLREIKGLDVFTIYLMEPSFLADGERSLINIYKLLRGMYGARASARLLTSIIKIFCDVNLMAC